jgi:hypothetical protein
MKKYISLLVLVFLGCSHPKHLNSKKATFNRYIRSLNRISLPFKCACANDVFAGRSFKFDSAGFAKYKLYDAARPFGVIYHDRNFIVVMDLVNADYCIDPILVSYDKKGNKLDSLNLYGNSFIDTASSSMPLAKIEPNKSIIVIDTTKNWKLADNSSKIPGSETKKIDSTIYYLSKNGKFVKKK